MNTLGRLERLLLAGDITEEEYKEKKEEASQERLLQKRFLQEYGP